MHVLGSAGITGSSIGGAGSTILLTIAANTNNYNIRTQAGSPLGSASVTVVVNSGIIVSSNGFGAAMTTGTNWGAGSTILIVNHGYIEGFGGAGNGGVGGDAILITKDISIDNSDGYIRGGGGGGAQGAAAATNNVSGGGGGGGQGNVGGAAGPASGGFYPGTAGTAGSRIAPGSGGSGGNTLIGRGGSGGGGGGWGQPGEPCGINSEGVGGFIGGSAGYAVRLSGHLVSWLGGNNLTQVKGKVE